MKLKLIIIMALLHANGLAQNIRDNVFHNVIHIDDRNIFYEEYQHSHNKNNNILTDITIPSSHKKPVIFVVPNIPFKRLQHIYPEFSEIILITPNYELYKKMSPSRGEPSASSVLYHIQRDKGVVEIDSLVIKHGFPEMNYYENPLEGDYTEDFEYHQQEKGKIKVFYQDKDFLEPENEVIPLKESIAEYEKKFNKKIHYHQTYHKEHRFFENYYTLEGLTKEEKLTFILHRKWAVIANKSTKNIVFSPILVTPYWVKTDKTFIKR
ncbi:hypothetical protein [Capnocytophaga stomatis]|uniref:Uncharacterized protein n=2 Tax=Capnocytophaga stomatis TaxID=1848904 RepID=A0ABW8QCS8_9FLAO|nr:hypothetical protein CAPN002_18890 [Capnocytophaga stomatis]